MIHRKGKPSNQCDSGAFLTVAPREGAPVIQRDWAVSFDRVDGFLRSDPEIAPQTSGKYVYKACEITLERLPDRRLGSLVFPQSRVELSGADEDVEKIYRKLLLQFASAGG